LAVVLAGGLVAVAPSTDARADDTAITEAVGLWETSSSFHGAYSVQSGYLAFCDSPDKHAPYGLFWDAEQACGWQNDQGAWLTRAQINQLAYVMSKWGATSDNTTAAGVRFAVYHLSGYTDIGGGGVVPAHSNYDLWNPTGYGRAHAAAVGVLELAQAMVLEAEANANNWDGTGTLTSNAADGGPGGGPVGLGDTLTTTVTLPGIGAGKTVVFTVIHPDGSTTSHNVATDGADQAVLDYQIPAGGTGNWRVTASITGVPDSCPWFMQPKGDASLQTLIVARSSLRDWSDPDGLRVRLSAAPKASSVTSVQLLDGPGQIYDDVLLWDGLPGAGFTGEAVLYGPFASDYEAQNADVEGLTPVARASFSGVYDQDGKASVRTATADAQQPGFYVWVEGIDGTDASQPFVAPKENRRPETTLVFGPEISSRISSTVVDAGAELSDSFTLTGLQATVGGTAVSYRVTGGLYGPVASDSPACEGVDFTGAPKAAVVDHTLAAGDIGADGTATVAGQGAYRPPAAAAGSCYSYGYQVTATAGKDTVTVSHPAGQASQTAFVRVQPKVATTVSAQLILAGQPVSLSDHWLVTGCFPGSELTGRTDLYGPFPNWEQSQSVDFKDLEPLGSAGFAGVCGADGTLEGDSEDVTVDHPDVGYYVFDEHLDGTPASEPFDADKPDRPGETTLALAPVVESLISDQSAERGSTITDGAWISHAVADLRAFGASPEAGDDTAADPEAAVSVSDATVIRWTLAGGLYGPVGPDSSGTCEASDWIGAGLVVPGERDIDPAWFTGEDRIGLGVLGDYTIPQYGERGCYSYGYTLTGVAPDGSTITVDHPVGQPPQTTIVPFGAMIVTGTPHPAGPAGATAAGLAAAGGVLLIGLGWRTVRRRA
jgi:hypothetical protein